MISKTMTLAFVLLTTTSGWAKVATSVAPRETSSVVGELPSDNLYKWCPTAGAWVLNENTVPKDAKGRRSSEKAVVE